MTISQQTRVVAARYVKQENWTAAIDILFNVAQSLLKAGQGGSGGDLSLFLIDVYKQAQLKPDSGNKGKLLSLLRLFDAEEPTRKKFIGEMILYVGNFTVSHITDLVNKGGPRNLANIQPASRNCIMLQAPCMRKNTMLMMPKDT